jgi:hypothetical protein
MSDSLTYHLNKKSPYYRNGKSSKRATFSSFRFRASQILGEGCRRGRAAAERSGGAGGPSLPRRWVVTVVVELEFGLVEGGGDGGWWCSEATRARGVACREKEGGDIGEEEADVERSDGGGGGGREWWEVEDDGGCATSHMFGRSLHETFN